MGNAKLGEKRQKLERRRELIITSVVIGIVILGSYGFIFGLTWALNNPQPFAVVNGDSMIPTYRNDDLVVVQGVDPSEIKLEDIIVYKHPTEDLVIHRVIKVTPVDSQLFFTAKGDNNARPIDEFEENIPANAVVGKVILHVPSMGVFFLTLSRPLVDGITLGNSLSILLIALLIFYAYRTPSRERKEEA